MIYKYFYLTEIIKCIQFGIIFILIGNSINKPSIEN